MDAEESLYFPGDLIWAKVHPFPLWPCMVTYHPGNGAYYRHNGALLVSYRVQLFGPHIIQTWTDPGNENCCYYKGEMEHFSRVKDLKNAIKFPDSELEPLLSQALMRHFTIPENYKVNWNTACKKAEEAFAIPEKEKRYASYYVFLFPDKKSDNSEKDICASEEEPKVSAMKNSNKVCDTCQINEAEVECTEKCNKYFHLSCLGLKKIPEKFRCVGCLNVVKCGICQISEGVKKCSLRNCITHFHANCIGNDYLHKELNLCPNHVCMTCSRKKSTSYAAVKGPYYRCKLCPLAFHQKEMCLPAGFFLKVEDEKVEFVCPQHLKGKLLQDILRVTSCLMCDNGGELINCISCPAAFHRNCLTEIVPSGDYKCYNCKHQTYLEHDMVVMATTGGKEWWPAQIISEKNIPAALWDIPKSAGEFAISYYAINTFAWAHSGMVFPYEYVYKKCTSELKDKIPDFSNKSYEDAGLAHAEYALKQLKNSSLQKELENMKIVLPKIVVLPDEKNVLEKTKSSTGAVQGCK